LSDFPQLGLTEADVIRSARAADPVDLQQLLMSLERVLEVVSARETITEAKGLPGKLAVVKKGYADDLTALMSDLKDGAVSPKEFEKQVRPLVSQNFRQAFELGRGGKATEGDEEWLKRAVDSEVGYARDLAGQVAKGSDITPDVRANRYAAALDGVSWNGKVESMPDDTVIHWRLGQAEHCDSCILLAAHSPYDKWSLPTTPRAGDTDCRMNCKCKLVFEQGDGAGEPKSGVFGIDAYLSPNEIPIPKQGQGLLDWLRPPEPPDGLRRPEGRERLAVDGMFAEVNYYRRLMSQIDDELDPEGFLEAAAARKEANAKLIDYMEERSLWDRPQLSVDDAISGKDIPLLAERELFEQGISGEALADENVAREVSKLVDRYKLNVGKKFKGGD
jgi:hypothetical protein